MELEGTRKALEGDGRAVLGLESEMQSCLNLPAH